MKLYKVLFKTIFLSFLAFAFLFVSCKKDDPDPVVVVDNNEIVGKWQLTAINSETTGTTLGQFGLIKLAAPCILDLKFTFTGDNKVSTSDCDAAVIAISSFIPISSTTEWKVESGTLKLTNDKTVQTLPLKQNGDEMTITVPIPGADPAQNALLVLKRIK